MYTEREIMAKPSYYSKLNFIICGHWFVICVLEWEYTWQMIRVAVYTTPDLYTWLSWQYTYNTWGHRTYI